MIASDLRKTLMSGTVHKNITDLLERMVARASDFGHYGSTVQQGHLFVNVLLKMKCNCNSI
eukprot:694661-Amphidinium_carterae.1